MLEYCVITSRSIPVLFNDQRHAKDLIVGLLVLEISVLAELLAVVRDDDDNGSWSVSVDRPEQPG